jgi:carbonic anhydrase
MTYVIAIRYMGCGMFTFTYDEVKRKIQSETAVRPQFTADVFSNLEDTFHKSIARIKTTLFLSPEGEKFLRFNSEKRSPS